jgi:hypothetical protein
MSKTITLSFLALVLSATLCLADTRAAYPMDLDVSLGVATYTDFSSYFSFQTGLSVTGLFPLWSADLGKGARFGVKLGFASGIAFEGFNRIFTFYPGLPLFLPICGAAQVGFEFSDAFSISAVLDAGANLVFYRYASPYFAPVLSGGISMSYLIAKRMGPTLDLLWGATGVTDYWNGPIIRLGMAFRL